MPYPTQAPLASCVGQWGVFWGEREKVPGWARVGDGVTVSLGRGLFLLPLPGPTGSAFVPFWATACRC
jgi:hypothetical protein